MPTYVDFLVSSPYAVDLFYCFFILEGNNVHDIGRFDFVWFTGIIVCYSMVLIYSSMFFYRAGIRMCCQ